MTNPAETLWLPVWDNMEYQKQLKIAARQLQAMYGPDSDYAKHRGEYQAWLDTHGPSLDAGDAMLVEAVGSLEESK